MNREISQDTDRIMWYWLKLDEVGAGEESQLSNIDHERIDELNNYDFSLYKISEYLKIHMHDVEEEVRIINNAIKIFSNDMTLEWFKAYLKTEKQNLEAVNEDTTYIDEICDLIDDLEITWEL